MEIVSVREHPEQTERFILYFQKRWGSPNTLMVYHDAITHAVTTEVPLPDWYLLMDGDTIAGCAGLITNDFVSRMDLYPWLCALYIEEDYRGHAYGKLLIERAKKDAKAGGFTHLYLVTNHVGYYEHYGFSYIGTGYHPSGDSSRIYESVLEE